MKTGYRVLTWDHAFECGGWLEKAAGVYVLRLQTTRGEAEAMSAEIVERKRAIEVIAFTDRGPVLPAYVRQVLVRDNGPLCDVACLLVGPEE